MISGAVRGRGAGDALARHLLKAENEAVAVIPARGLGSDGLVAQMRELVALSLGGRTDRPIYHVHVDPDPGLADEAAARARWWSLFESEFGLGGQPYCGVEHVKCRRRHEHRVYSLVRPSGGVIDLAWDYARREKCSRIVEFEFGLRPVPSKHARSIARRLSADGRADVAEWLERCGSLTAVRPVAPLTPRERLLQERTGVPLDAVRRAALAAWRESRDAAGYVAALRARGLDLRRGRKGPVIVDASGTAHLATRILGAAARQFEGKRILAAAVRARLDGITLEGTGDGRIGDRTKARRAGADPARHRRGGGADGGGHGGLGIRGSDRGAGGPDGSGCRRDAGGAGAALRRLRALPVGRRVILRRRLYGLDPRVEACIAATERAHDAVARIEAENAYQRERDWALWGMTDIWGIPLR
ncbi:relaxase/mobilization nuclease domain-containing protein [Methylorubrum populi]